MQVARSIETLHSSRLVVDLPESFVNHKIEILVVTLDEKELPASSKKRHAPPQLAGKAVELGNVFSSVSSKDWGMDE